MCVPAPIAKRYLRPRGSLAVFIDRFWSWDAPAPVPLPFALPGAGVELFVHYGTPFSIVKPDGTLARLPRLHTSALRHRSARFVATGPVGFVAARFRGACLRHFALRGARDLVDAFVPAEEWLGTEAAELPFLMAGQDSFCSRAGLLEAYLERRRVRLRAEPDVADALLERIYYASPTVSIDELSSQLGFSRRQFERRVSEASGLAPKQYQKVSRFHHAVKELMLAARSDYLPVALAWGFYDQAHFIHDFRTFAGRAPREVLTRENFMSHFYNTSLPR